MTINDAILYYRDAAHQLENEFPVQIQVDREFTQRSTVIYFDCRQTDEQDQVGSFSITHGNDEVSRLTSDYALSIARDHLLRAFPLLQVHLHRTNR